MIELFFLLLILSFSSSSIESALVCGGIFALFNSEDTARTQHRKKKTEPRNELDRLYFFYFKWDNLYFSIWTSKRKIKWFIRKHEKIDGNSNDNDQLDDTFCQCYNNTSSPVQPRRARARWDTVSQSLRSVASDLMSRCLKNCGIRLMTTPRERVVREIFMFSILSRLVWPIVRCQSTTCTRKEEKQKTWRREAERKTVFFELFLLRHVMTHYRSCLKFAIVKRPDIVRGWPSSPHDGTVMTGALELQQWCHFCATADSIRNSL